MGVKKKLGIKTINDDAFYLNFQALLSFFLLKFSRSAYDDTNFINRLSSLKF